MVTRNRRDGLNSLTLSVAIYCLNVLLVSFGQSKFIHLVSLFKSKGISLIKILGNFILKGNPLFFPVSVMGRENVGWDKNFRKCNGMG